MCDLVNTTNDIILYKLASFALLLWFRLFHNCNRHFIYCIYKLFFARQTIFMKYEVLFSMKKKPKQKSTTTTATKKKTKKKKKNKKKTTTKNKKKTNKKTNKLKKKQKSTTTTDQRKIRMSSATNFAWRFKS